MTNERFPHWIKDFTREYRALMARKATQAERQALIRVTEAQYELGEDALVPMFMA